jgi:hypothetical protein
MERVLTLCNKLQEQISRNASVDELLITVQMLQAELVHLSSAEPHVSSSAVAVDMPTMVEFPLERSARSEEKIVEVLQVDEAEVEAELEEIKRNIETRNKISAQNKPQFAFDPVEDTPTLTHQEHFEKRSREKEVHEVVGADSLGSRNEKLKQSKTELGETIQETAIKDLRKAIGVNDRFLFINELFRGDEVMYERSVKTINGFGILAEAEYWIRREMKLKLGWDENNPVVKQFDQLVRRRFS